MNNVLQFKDYYKQKLIYIKKIDSDNKTYKIILKINRKLISPYDYRLIQKKFKTDDFNLEKLGNFLVQNAIWFKLYLPLKNIRGFYIKHFPEYQSYLNYYEPDDNYDTLEKRPESHYVYIDIFNRQITGLYGKIRDLTFY